MKYVKIKSGSYNEAMMKLRMEYGEDAIPVSHRYIKEGGLLKTKLLAKNMVELTAAIPERNMKIKPKTAKKGIVDYTVGDSDVLKNTIKAMNKEQDPGSRLSSADKEFNFSNLNNPLSRKPVNSNPDTFSGNRDKTELSSGKINNEVKSSSDYMRFEKEFEEIKNTLKTLLNERTDKQVKRSSEATEENEFVKPYIKILQDNEFDIDERNFIIDKIKNTISADDLKDKYKIEKSLKDMLKSKIITCAPIKKGVKKQVIMFIGPTGVGKTTTLAKLGAIYALREEHKVAFITIDTYRIAATEQLKKYAGIMKIPIHVVNDPVSFKEVIANEKSEIILIDTSGRSHKNELKISEIKNYADSIDYDCEKILCVSANTRKNDLKDIFKSFGKINFDSVIITKVDESSCIGSVVDVAEKFNKPISYFTNGQEVPNDISVADPNKIVDMIISPETEYAGG
ncbi:MAG: flagellar biosynthesis protein FlhF [Spirochaetes bacterium]|nr:flagellar biosynthesis protein FlhF [Spirochaetota bacterium]